MTDATLGIGTFLEYETTIGASPLAFTTLEEVQDIPEVPNTREFVEATHQGSGDSKEYIAGLRDAEQFTVTCNYIPGTGGTHRAAWNMFKDKLVRKWQLRQTTASPEEIFRGDAVVAAVSHAFPLGDKKAFNITLRRTGAWDFV